LMRTVPRESPPAPSSFAGRGGSVIRTVSFFGSFRSAIRC
jgi:hypothetical protein